MSLGGTPALELTGISRSFEGVPRAPRVSHPSDCPVEHVVGSAAVSVAPVMTTLAENTKVACEFVSMALIREVMNVEVLCSAAVHAAAAGALERILPAHLPLPAAEIGAVLRLPRRPVAAPPQPRAPAAQHRVPISTTAGASRRSDPPTSDSDNRRGRRGGQWVRWGPATRRPPLPVAPLNDRLIRDATGGEPRLTRGSVVAIS
jgi:hypothetical protein